MLTEIDDTLRDEGFAREMVNKIQNTRKCNGYQVIDRIGIIVSTADPLAKKAISKYGDYICGETLAVQIDLNDNIPDKYRVKNWNINGYDTAIGTILIKDRS